MNLNESSVLEPVAAHPNNVDCLQLPSAIIVIILHHAPELVVSSILIIEVLYNHPLFMVNPSSLYLSWVEEPRRVMVAAVIL